MASASRCSPWVRENPYQQGLVSESQKYSQLLITNMARLCTYVRIEGLWIYLTSLRVINRSDMDRLQSKATNEHQVAALIDYLLQSPCWKLHGFLRALCMDNQDAMVRQVLRLDPQQYKGDQVDLDQAAYLKQREKEIKSHREVYKRNLTQGSLFDIPSLDLPYDMERTYIQLLPTSDERSTDLEKILPADILKTKPVKLDNPGNPGKQDKPNCEELHPEETEDIPNEVLSLSPELQNAYKAACAGGTHMVYQCRVMLIGHEGAGKTNILNTLLKRNFQKEHIITNGMEVEINKTKDWCPHSIENEYEYHVADFMIGQVTRQKKCHDQSQQQHFVSRMEDQADVTVTESQNEVLSKPSRVQEDTHGWVGSSELQSNTDGQARASQVQPKVRMVQSENEDVPKPKTVELEPSVSAPENKTDVKDERRETSPLQQEGIDILDVIPENIMKITGVKLSDESIDGNKPVELFFWDSGGQGVFYITTKMFLTRRCVYIIAMDMTKGLDCPIPTYRKNRFGKTVPDAGCPQNVKEHLEYWLSCLHTFVPEENHQESSKKSSLNVIIVGTHKDECTPEMEEHFIQCIETLLESRNEHLQGIFALSNKNRNEEDIQELKDKVITLARKQGYKVPLSWFDFKKKLIIPSPDNIPMKTYPEVTLLHDPVLMKGEQGVKAALTFFHEVGDIIFFDEPSLRNFIITEPRWLIEQFRKVITVPTYHQQQVFPFSCDRWKELDEKGILNEDVLKFIWPENIRKQLVCLMMKFALLLSTSSCYAVNHDEAAGSNQYLVPCLLPLAGPSIPNRSKQGLTVPPLLLVPSNRTMPVGLTSRLFVALVNEDGWKVAGQIYGDAATFLPEGEDSEVQIAIRQRSSYIEVCGEETSDEDINPEFSVPLKIILDRLDAITSSVCPLPGFTICIHCLECLGMDRTHQLDLGKRGEKLKYTAKVGEGSETAGCRRASLKDFMYCSHKEHMRKFRTSQFHIWFRQENIVRGSNAILIKMAESMREELITALPGLLERTGPGVHISVYFISNIRALKILQETQIQEVEAAHTPARKVDVLVKALLPCSQKNLILFAWVLVKMDLGHQLQSITRDIQRKLKCFSIHEIRQLKVELDHSAEGANGFEPKRPAATSSFCGDTYRTPNTGTMGLDPAVCSPGVDAHSTSESCPPRDQSTTPSTQTTDKDDRVISQYIPPSVMSSLPLAAEPDPNIQPWVIDHPSTIQPSSPSNNRKLGQTELDSHTIQPQQVISRESCDMPLAESLSTEGAQANVVLTKLNPCTLTQVTNVEAFTSHKFENSAICKTTSSDALLRQRSGNKEDVQTEDWGSGPLGDSGAEGDPHFCGAQSLLLTFPNMTASQGMCISDLICSTEKQRPQEDSKMADNAPSYIADDLSSIRRSQEQRSALDPANLCMSLTEAVPSQEVIAETLSTDSTQAVPLLDTEEGVMDHHLEETLLGDYCTAAGILTNTAKIDQSFTPSSNTEVPPHGEEQEQKQDTTLTYVDDSTLHNSQKGSEDDHVSESPPAPTGLNIVSYSPSSPDVCLPIVHQRKDIPLELLESEIVDLPAAGDGWQMFPLHLVDPGKDPRTWRREDNIETLSREECSRVRNQIIMNQLQAWLDLQNGLISDGPWSRQDVERELKLDSAADKIEGHLMMVTNVYLEESNELQPPPPCLTQLLVPKSPELLPTKGYVIKGTKGKMKRVDERNLRVEAEMQVTFFL